MELDKITYYDLSILNAEEEYSLLHRINFCKTDGGKEQLHYLITHPYNEIEKINHTQAALKVITGVLSQWPAQISNGTVFVLQKFLGYPFDKIPNSYSPLPAFFYKVFETPDYGLVRYSVSHAIDFLKGMQTITTLLGGENTPPILNHICIDLNKWLNKEPVQQMIQTVNTKELSPARMLRFGHYLRFEFKTELEGFINHFHLLDAYYSMAAANHEFQLQFPVVKQSDEPLIEAKGLYHLLLKTPVAYDVLLNPQTNFLFLTGANMGGKSTFIKSVGCAVYLAHIGMGVPAQSMQLSLFDGLLSNIHVEDNLAKGESYFFNEVQRIKNTILKITDGRKWLVLIDELFKGTNIQDAMHCSSTVIKGLLKMKNSLFILSTHLYEIGEELKVYPNISFRYFETTAVNEQLHFSYQLKEGISSDRFGYLILKREKVVELLDKL